MVRTKAKAKRNAAKESAKESARVDEPPEKDGGSKIKRRVKNGNRALREIRRAQSSKGIKGLPKNPFRRQVKAIIARQGALSGESEAAVRISKAAVEMLQIAAEDYLLTLFACTNVLAIHGNRKKITQNDLRLAVNLTHNFHFIHEADATKKMLRGVPSRHAAIAGGERPREESSDKATKKKDAAAAATDARDPVAEPDAASPADKDLPSAVDELD